MILLVLLLWSQIDKTGETEKIGVMVLPERKKGTLL